MIVPADIELIIKAATDTEDSDRHSWNTDIREAVNYAINYIVALYTKALADNKISEESLSELYKTVSATLTSNSYVTVPSDLWSVIAVYVGGYTIKDGKAAKRTTIEEWSKIDRNVFASGNDLMCVDELVEYAYLSPILGVINIKPLSPGKNCTIVYIKKPTLMSQTTSAAESDIEFPVSITDLLVQKALTFLGMKEAGEIATYTVSSREVEQLVTLTT